MNTLPPENIQKILDIELQIEIVCKKQTELRRQLIVLECDKETLLEEQRKEGLSLNSNLQFKKFYLMYDFRLWEITTGDDTVKVSKVTMYQDLF